MYFFPAKLRRRSECGGPWTEDEWISLIDMHSNNVSLEDIANNLSRTVITIRFAIKEIPSNLHNHKKVSLQSKQEKIIQFISDRNIKKLIHFTDIRNIKNIRQNGLLSVNYLKKRNLDYFYNDSYRFDGYKGICLSITNPNMHLIRSYSARNRNIKWAKIEIDPSILRSLECLFFDTNAAFSKFKDYSKNDLSNFSSLRGMFSEKVENKSGILERENKKSNETTCEQAEVIVKDYIPINKIIKVTRIYVD
ncbi:DUF4433 domain-containing protein [Gammaproteobacteria bacterium]|nr:DUF4433 domain-containing protein [Gammaproteobacteria bacterium]